MFDWLISVPVWGDRYVSIFKEVCLPAIRQAIITLNKPAKLIIYTNEHIELVKATYGLSVEYSAVLGSDQSFGSLSECHKDTICRAKEGQRVALLTADLLLAPQSFHSCEARFEAGKSLVCCMGIRACDNPLPPVFSTGRELLSWAWQNRHPMTKECTWPDGTSYDLWRMYFEKGDEVCCRLCLPHPIAFVKGKTVPTFSPTVDVNLISNFALNHIHLETDPDKIAMVELSPLEKEFVITETFKKRFENKLPTIPSLEMIKSRYHRYMFSHKIIIKGSGGDCGDSLVVRRLLEGK